MLRYPSTYINQQFRTFFKKYTTSSSFLLLPVIKDENQYFAIRHKLRQEPSDKQTQAAKRASRIDIRNELRFNKHITTTSMATAKQKINKKYQNCLIIHCRHEKRLETLKRDMHQIYNDIFNQTPAMDVKLILGHRNNQTTKHELSTNKPDKRLLKNNMIKRKPNTHSHTTIKYLDTENTS